MNSSFEQSLSPEKIQEILEENKELIIIIVNLQKENKKTEFQKFFLFLTKGILKNYNQSKNLLNYLVY
jgi:hypothetical protein